MVLMNIFLIITANTICSNAVTYSQSSGQLGDQLIYYCIAKYIAVKYNFPFFYKPFKHSDQLKLSSLEKPFNPQNFIGYTHLAIGNEREIRQKPTEKILYEITDKHWKDSTPDREWYGLYQSTEFRNLARTLIAPKVEIPSLNMPTDGVTVALHFRTGEGREPVSMTSVGNHKFPFFSYYIEHIKNVLSLFPNKKIYIHIFTDALNPTATLKKFKSHFPQDYVIFSTRMVNDSWGNNVLTDLFQMTKFDCLIRPQSGFSAIAQLIGYHKIIFHFGGITYIEKI